MVQTAWKRSQGEVPGELQELIQQFLAPANIPWQQVLRQFIGTAGRIGKTGTWKRPHRRFGHNTPGLRKQQFLNLVVGIDVSDSTDTQPLREAFARELLQISRGRQSRITVLYAGSRIQKIAHFSGQPQISEVYRGGGYTDLRPIFAHVQKMNPRPAAVIYLTDGYGPAPEQSDIPTLWVLSPDGQKPVDWGLELRLEMLKENR
jgi:predicted metal-dependent peptidase